MNRTKKMSLSVIENELSMSEMEAIQAGSINWGCVGGVVSVIGGAFLGFSPAGCLAIIGGGCAIMANC
jgi:hypothetical protein